METSLRSRLLVCLCLLALCGCSGVAGGVGEAPPAPEGPAEEDVPISAVVPGVADAGSPDAGGTAPEAIAFGALDVVLHVEELAGVARAGEPVRSGVPLPRAAAVLDPSLLAVTDDSGKLVPYQLRVTSRWQGAPNDSSKPIKWVLLDFPASVAAQGAVRFHLRSLAKPLPVTGSLVREDSPGRIVIDTGAAVFTLSKTAFNLLDGVALSGGAPLLPSDPAAGVFLRAPGGALYLASAGATLVQVEEDGPQHAVVVAKGKHRSASGALLDFTVREHFDRGRAEVLVAYTFTDRDLLHIGDYTSVDRLGLKLPVSVGADATYAFGGEGAPARGPLTAEVFQRQSGGLDAAMGARFNPGNADTLWYSNGGGAAGGGGKAPGWVDLSGSAGGVTAAVRWYWQQYPKKLSASPAALTVDLWPAEEVDLRVYAAAQKTHEVLFSFHPPQTSPEASGRSAAARLAEPLFARCEPAWYAASWVWNRLGIADPAAYPAAERALVDNYFKNVKEVEFKATFGTRRFNNNGRGHEYSMWDFGDGREADWSNLAYDTPRSLLIHWAITGEREYWRKGMETALHLRDVDIEHSPLDTRVGLQTGRGVAMPWLGRTRYNPTGGLQSHDLGFKGRTGYGFEHHKGQGLADHYFLTGDALSKEVLAETYHYYEQWKVDANNGYLRTDGTRVVSHMLLVLLGYYDAFGTAEARERIDYSVRFLNDWQRRTTGSDPNGWMWMTAGDSTASWMNGITAESLMLYELNFPEGIAVRQNIINAAKWSIAPGNGLLVRGSQGPYFNAWTGENYGISHATVLDPMMGPLLGYASAATSEPAYATLGKQVLQGCISLDGASPYVKSFTQQTRLVPAFLWYLQTPQAQAEGT